MNKKELIKILRSCNDNIQLLWCNPDDEEYKQFLKVKKIGKTLVFYPDI